MPTGGSGQFVGLRGLGKKESDVFERGLYPNANYELLSEMEHFVNSDSLSHETYPALHFNEF